MGAMATDEAVFTVIAAVKNKFFAHQGDCDHGTFFRQFLGQCGWLPVMAHEIAAPGARAGFGCQPVLLCIQHLICIQDIVQKRRPEE